MCVVGGGNTKEQDETEHAFPRKVMALYNFPPPLSNPFQHQHVLPPFKPAEWHRQPLRTTAQERKTGLAVSDTKATEEIHGGSKADGVCELDKGRPVGRIIKELTSWQNLSPTETFPRTNMYALHCVCMCRRVYVHVSNRSPTNLLDKGLSQPTLYFHGNSRKFLAWQWTSSI